MKSNRLQIAIFLVAIILLAGLSTIWIGRAAVRAVENALAERNKVGFEVSTGGVHFRSPNSELLAPAWNEPVTLADPATFKTVFQSPEYCLGADSKTVFMGQGRCVYRLSDSDAPTFRLLSPDGRFTCDAKHVYFMGFQLPKADPTSFKILGQFTSKDATQVYVGPQVLEGADPNTFRIEDEGVLPELFAAYSDGPCTVRKFKDNGQHVNGFQGQDKNRRFNGRIRHNGEAGRQ